jgi:adenylyltransferase/sulfurtransferase
LDSRRQARILVIGVGGIGTPLALVLARAGVGTLGLVDDDRVERTNLHRQILFREDDVGRDKLDAAADGLERLAPGARVELHRTRFVPDNALALARRYDVIVEGADNFATKFLVADAARAAGRPVVHAAAVRTMGTVMAVGPLGAPCYRCVFEDVPRTGDGAPAPSCADAGVLGPLLGLVAAFQADLALSIVDGSPRFGELVRIDVSELEPRVRRGRLAARAGCDLCEGLVDGASIEGDPDRYGPGPDACATS